MLHDILAAPAFRESWPNRSLQRFAVILVAGLALPAAASAQAPAPPASTRTNSGKGAISWTLMRTPWGDPDLQGLWPSTDMQGTPF